MGMRQKVDMKRTDSRCEKLKKKMDGYKVGYFRLYESKEGRYAERL